MKWSDVEARLKAILGKNVSEEEKPQIEDLEAEEVLNRLEGLIGAAVENPKPSNDTASLESLESTYKKILGVLKSHHSAIQVLQEASQSQGEQLSSLATATHEEKEKDDVFEAMSFGTQKPPKSGKRVSSGKDKKDPIELDADNILKAANKLRQWQR